MKGVSLYIPCYNAENYLETILSGVFRQTYPLKEVILVNDGSTDNTHALGQQLAKDSPFPIKLIDHFQNRGLGNTRNTGVTQSNSELVASIDADVVPEPDWLEKLVQEMELSKAGGVGGKLIETHTGSMADAWRNTHMRQSWGEEKVLNPPFLFGSNTLFQKQLLMNAGLYHPQCKTNAEDVKLCEKIRKKVKLVYTPEARCWHLRRDTICSVLKTYWQWHFYGQYSKIIKRKIFFSNITNLKVFKNLIFNDIKKYYIQNIMIDHLYLIFSIYYDWKYTILINKN